MALVDVSRVVAREHRESAHQVFEFANIARPVIRAERGDHIPRQLTSRQTLDRRMIEKMSCEQGDVLPPLAERGNVTGTTLRR